MWALNHQTIIEKSPNMLNRFLMLLTMLLTVSCCGDDDFSSPAPAPDMMGTWSGNYTSSVDQQFSFSIDIIITDQYGDDFEGIWKLTTSTDWPEDSIVEGYTYSGNSGMVLVDLYLTNGSDIECCSPFFGCSILPFESLSVSGYLVKYSVIDNDTIYLYNCVYDQGVMKIYRK